MLYAGDRRGLQSDVFSSKMPRAKSSMLVHLGTPHQSALSQLFFYHFCFIEVFVSLAVVIVVLRYTEYVCCCLMLLRPRILAKTGAGK